MTPGGLDELDHQILQELRTDGRRSIRDLAQQLDVPETTVRDHIHRMEESGAIQSHRPILDQTALGVTESAWVFARCDEDDRMDVTQKLGSHPQVVAIRRFATDPEHFAMRVLGSRDQTIAHVIEAALLELDFRIKTVIPIATTPQPNPDDELFWPGEEHSLFGARVTG